MANRFKCPICGATGDIRGANGHMRGVHNMPNATADDVEVMEDDRPVREVSDAGELEQKVESGDLVGVEDDAIIFRREIIITDSEVKEQIAEKLVEEMSGGAQI